MQATCKTCGEVFSYEKKVGPGRLRRYCDLCLQPQHIAVGPFLCERCGITFTAQRVNATHCSDCRRIVRCEQAKQSRERVKQNGITIVVPESKRCGHCKQVKPASDFISQRDRPNGLTGWCRACKNADQNAKRPTPIPPGPNGNYCEVCGAALVWQQLRCCASPECKAEHNRRCSQVHAAAKKELKARTCKECGVTFVSEYGNGHRTFCSEKCLRKHVGRNNKAVRRARLHGAGIVERVDLLFILKRDGWRCYLCGVLTPRSLRGTVDPCAPEVDHVIPVARGGTHTADNLRCCCRACNARKSDKVLTEVREKTNLQLSLFA